MKLSRFPWLDGIIGCMESLNKTLSINCLIFTQILLQNKLKLLHILHTFFTIFLPWVQILYNLPVFRATIVWKLTVTCTHSHTVTVSESDVFVNK